MTDVNLHVAAALDPVAFARRQGFIAEPWQERLMRSTSRRLLLACSRQVGKSTSVAIRAVHTAVYTPGALVLIIAPGQRQAEEFLKTARGVYRAAGRPVATVADSTTTLELANGSRIVALPGTEGTTRGFAGAKLLVIDEAARVDDDVFAGVLPMVATDGTVAVLSTPWGQRGFFWKLWSEPANGWERHRITVHESGQWNPQRIAEMRASVPSHAFASDYEAQFTDTDESLFSAENIRAAFGHNFAPLFPLGDPR